MSSRPLCIQVNWQRQLGGGEVYTRFFTRALQELGWDVSLIVDQKARFWEDLGLEGVNFIPISHGREIPHVLPSRPSVVVTHTTLAPEAAEAVASRHLLGGIVHMPLNDRDPKGLAHYRKIFPVSAYVRSTIAARGYSNVFDLPLLGVADLASRGGKAGAIIRQSEYDWDKRKVRDRLLSWCAPLGGLRPKQQFARRPGLTLGVVSRLTPIKQFPLLFSYLAPVLAAFPDVSLEIFGSGGYASVRDLRTALAPLGQRARFWGHQSNPASVYPLLDYVLSGLPEREALGLNLIEAQACGTPVLAVDAPPFIETVVDGASGFLYPDPRRDGDGFRTLIERLRQGATRPDPRLATSHLAQFSPAAFQTRVAAAMAALSS